MIESSLAHSRVVTPQLLKSLVSQFRLKPRSVHGPAHWLRVHRNGMELAVMTGANTVVVELFAVLHDSCRRNDGRNPSHGPRAAILAEVCRGMGLFACTDDELETLQVACEGHTSERYHSDATIATCWDADRLDLARVGIKPAPHRMCTAPAKEPDRILAASLRAEQWLEKTYF